MSRDMTKPTKWVCAQQRLRSAWPSAQSDQSLCCAFNGQLRTQAFFMRTAKTLIRLGGCPGWSEYSLGAYSVCWFCHVAAHILRKTTFFPLALVLDQIKVWVKFILSKSMAKFVLIFDFLEMKHIESQELEFQVTFWWCYLKIYHISW